MRRRIATIIAVAVLFSGWWATPVHALPFTLTSNGQTLSGDSDTTPGVQQLTVGALAIDQLFEELWYWGNSAGTPVPLSGGTFLNPNPFADFIRITYANVGGWMLVFDHIFTGGLVNSLWTTHVSATPLPGTVSPLFLYGYIDYDLGYPTATAGGDTATFTSGSPGGILNQQGQGVNLTWTINRGPSAVLTGQGLVPGFDLAPWPSLLSCITSSGYACLDGNASFMIPGDVTFAFGEFFDPARGTDGFSIDRRLSVPEPTSLLLMGLSLIGASSVARRRRRTTRS